MGCFQVFLQVTLYHLCAMDYFKSIWHSQARIEEKLEVLRTRTITMKSNFRNATAN